MNFVGGMGTSDSYADLNYLHAALNQSRGQKVKRHAQETMTTAEPSEYPEYEDYYYDYEDDSNFYGEHGQVIIAVVLLSTNFSLYGNNFK